MQNQADFHALLTRDCIVVANRGQLFTKEGLRAICQAHISTKSGESKTAIKDESDASEFLEDIRKQRLGAYKQCPHDLTEAANQENGLRSEYASRILVELLQNAHDAIVAGQSQIGSKGVGFKSVLNICQEPRIHSGPLHCVFNQERSHQEFLNAGLINESDNVPVMRLPFPFEVSYEDGLIQNMIQEYETVIVLPFIDKYARNTFLGEWQECVEDTTLLLFLSGVGSIIWERCDESGNSLRKWRRENEGACIKVYDEYHQRHTEYWKVLSSKRANVALQLDDEGVPIPCRNYPNIRVFFETEERSPFPFLLNADLPLKEGRANVLMADNLNWEKLEEVIQDLAILIRQALADIADTGLFLDLLCPHVEPDKMGNLQRKIWQVTIREISSLKVPGTNNLRLDSVRLRPVNNEHNISWWWFDCELWNDFKKILSDYRIGNLSELYILPPGVETDEREKTVLHINSQARYSLEELLTLPLLPIEGIHYSESPSHTNIFFPPKNASPVPPSGIDVCFLKLDFVEEIEKHPKSKDLRKILVDILSISEFAPVSLIEKAILPVLREGEQPDGLIEFLCEVIVPTLSDKDLIFDWRVQTRREFAEIFLIPTRNNNCLPAKKMYAGVEWTGNDFLEKVYANRQDIGFLHLPPADKQEREHWQRFYQYIGVGWCPKVLPLVCYNAKSSTYEGPKWENGIFPIKGSPSDWHEYCKELNDFAMEPRNARLRQNWSLDGTYEVLLQDGAFDVISMNWSYYSQYTEAIIYRSSNLKEDKDNDRLSRKSYLRWLFQTSDWVPVKEVSDKQKPYNVFLRSEIVRELRNWAFELKGNAHEEFLKSIGVRSGWNEITNDDWHRWLNSSACIPLDRMNSDKNVQNSVCNLYRAALKHWRTKKVIFSKERSDTWTGHIWCVERHDYNTETWELTDTRKQVFFLDRPALDEIRLPGLWIFPVRLERLEQTAKERFNLKLLSDHLYGNPVQIVPLNYAEKKIDRHIKKHLDAVDAYFQVRYPDKASYICSYIPQVKVLEKLKVRFSLNDQVIGDGVKLDAYHSHEGDSWTLWLDSSLINEDGTLTPTLWEHVANTFVYAHGLSLEDQPCLKDLFLYEEGDLYRKLLNLGVTKETVEQVVATKPIKPVVTKHRQEKDEQATPVDESGHEEVEHLNIVNDHTHIASKTGNTSSSSSVRSNRDGGTTQKRNVSGKRRINNSSQPGIEAQEWMREELKKRLEPEGWQISQDTTRDNEYRETDIELMHYEYGTYHVEVKHCETETIFWSEKEVDKASQNLDRYLLVVLKHGIDSRFEEYWITSPLDCLQDLPCTGIWEWKVREEYYDYVNRSSCWVIPTPRPMRSAQFIFKIKLDQNWLKAHGYKFESIKTYLSSSRSEVSAGRIP